MVNDSTNNKKTNNHL